MTEVTLDAPVKKAPSAEAPPPPRKTESPENRVPGNELYNSALKILMTKKAEAKRGPLGGRRMVFEGSIPYSDSTDGNAEEVGMREVKIIGWGDASPASLSEVDQSHTEDVLHALSELGSERGTIDVIVDGLHMRMDHFGDVKVGVQSPKTKLWSRANDAQTRELKTILKDAELFGPQREQPE
jgi:hypothetical protein